MKLHDDRWSFSPTDLANFLRCEHRITLDRKLQRGEIAKPQVRPSAHTDLLVRRGGEHERNYIRKLKDQGRNVVEIPDRDEISADEARAQTLDAMKRGADVVVQALLTDETWLGYADFLFKVDKPSDLGDWSYEVGDTKLATTVHPHVVLQLGVYCDLLETIQGRAPETMHVILGDNRCEPLTRSELDAYIRRVRTRFVSEVSSASIPGTENREPETEPYPVNFCALCKWNDPCYRQWIAEDNLCLVADIRRDQIKRLHASGIFTITDLGESDPSHAVPEIAASTFEKLANQARLQLHHKRTLEHIYEFLDPEDRRGFQRLPKPSPGDLFFDIEADPFEELVYLFGIALHPDNPLPRRHPSGDHPHYLPFWAHDRAEEKRGFESTIDLILETLRQHPDAHVYHYGPADRLALQQLMGRYGTREQELDDLLRRQIFVDLLGVVRQAIRISHPSYSLKKVETFYMDRTSEGVIDAGGAIVAYENWLQSRNDDDLKEIESYNREDCESTLGLQSWLLDLREELERDRGITLLWPEPREPEKTPAEEEAERVEADDLSSALHAGLSDDPEEHSEDQRALWILGHLLHYHRRDAKPGWWDHFSRMTQTPEELVEEKESIGLLEPTGNTDPVTKSSTGVEFRFPPQQHKLSEGDEVRDPEHLDDKGYALSAGSIHELTDDEGKLWLKRGPSLKDQPLPRAIVPSGPINDKTIRQALRRFARSIVDGGFEATPYEAARDILLRRPPRLRDHERGAPIQEGDLEVTEIVEISRRIDHSALFIQGPPGSGKTYRGARIIVDLIDKGMRVGVCATSHKAIGNLLKEVEKQATEAGVSFRGLKRSSANAAYHSKLTTPLIRNTSDKKKSFPGETTWDEYDPSVRLVAGTPWCFSTDRHDQQFDVLMIDEAGQMALATALAVSTAARSVILLGDPLQLAQVSQGTHPEGCGASVLEHLLGEDHTIPPERGIFLEHTRRMHPDVCRFISDVVYDNRLESKKECATHVVKSNGESNTGLRFIGVEHSGNSQDAIEEAEMIADISERFLEGSDVTTWNWNQKHSVTRPLTQKDVLVVTPYNAQVRMIKKTLRARGLADIPVGTVDKFQGQEAPIVFFSMATSSGEEVPRTLDFLFSRNRLNVAISRAQCLAILVASPKLLDVHCKTIEQMKLVNSLCRFVEMACS